MSGPVPTAADTVSVGGAMVLRFHPLHKRIKDNIPRCIGCGQIDEDGWHEAEYCPLAGGALPFPTSTLTLKLSTDSGFRHESKQRITLAQWVSINEILNAPKGGAA